MAAEPETEFDAFISYRRSDATRAARRLRHRLIEYRLPPGLRYSPAAAKLSIYLDTIYERATEDFFEHTIKPALRRSRHLIIVQSPDARKTRADGKENWVVQEIRYFRSLPQGANVSVALAEGEMGDPLPGDLQKERGNIEIVDIRRLGSGALLRRDELLLPFIATLRAIPDRCMPELRQEEARRSASRMRWTVGAALALVCVLAGLLAWALVSRAGMERAEHEAVSALGESQRSLANSLGLLARAARRNGDDLAASVYLHKSRELTVTPLVAAELLSLRHPGAVFDGFLSISNAFPLSFHPTRPLLAAGHFDGEAQLIDVASGAATHLSRTSAIPVSSLAFSRDGNTLAIARRSPPVYPYESGGSLLETLRWTQGEWRSLTGQEQSEPAGVTCVALDAGGDHILLGGEKSILLGRPGGGAAQLIATRPEPATSVAITDDASYAAAADMRGALVVWNVRSGAQVRDLSNPPPKDLVYAQSLSGLAFAPSSHLLASGGYDGKVHVLNLEDSAGDFVLAGHVGPVNALAFSPDGSWLASGAYDGTIRLWDLPARQLLTILSLAPGATAQRLSFSADGQYLAATEGIPRARSDEPLDRWRYGPAGLWRLKRNGLLGSADRDPTQVAAEGYTASGESLHAVLRAGALEISVGQHGRCKMGTNLVLWSPLAESQQSGRPCFLLSTAPSDFVDARGVLQRKLLPGAATGGRFVCAAAFNHADRPLLALATASASGDHLEDAHIEVVDGASGMVVERLALAGEFLALGPMEFSPDDKRLAIATGRKVAAEQKDFGTELLVWEHRARDRVHPLSMTGAAFCSVKFSPDSGWVAAAGVGGEISLWSLRDTNRFDLAMDLAGAPALVAFAPGGHQLIAVSLAQMKSWDLGDRRSRSLELTTEFFPSSLDFHPGGELIAIGLASGEVEFRDAVTLERVGSLSAHAGAVAELKVSPDGARMSSVGRDGARTWGGYPPPGSEPARYSRLELANTTLRSLAWSELPFAPRSNQKALTSLSDPAAAAFWRIWSQHGRSGLAAGTPKTPAPEELIEWRRANPRHYLGGMSDGVNRGLGIPDRLGR